MNWWQYLIFGICACALLLSCGISGSLLEVADLVVVLV